MSKLKEWGKQYWPALGFLAISLLIVGPWFFRPGYLFFTDFVWGTRIDLVWASDWFYPTLILKLLSLAVGISPVQKLLIGAIIFLVLFSGYFLA